MMLIMKIPIGLRNDDIVFVLLLLQNIESRLHRRRRRTANGDDNGWWPMVYVFCLLSSVVVRYSTVRYGTVGDLRFKEIVIIDMCRLSTKKNDYFRVPVVRVIYVTICVKLDISRSWLTSVV